MLTVLFSVGLAASEPQGPVTAEEPPLPGERVDLNRETRPSRWLGTAGLLTSAAGGPVAFGGGVLWFSGAVNDDNGRAAAGVGVMVAGGTALVAGPPMLLGGTMRTAHILQDNGVPINRTLGWVGWGLYGVGGFGFAASVIDPNIAIVTSPLLVASVAFGGLQSLKNHGARRRAIAMGTRLEQPAGRVVYSVAPWVDSTAIAERRPPARGLALVGSF